MVQAYAHWMLRWRFVLIVVVLALVGWAASGMRFLQFKTDYRMFFGQENPQLELFDALENTYAKNDNVLFVVAPRDGQVFTPQTLAAVERLTQAAWQIPHAGRVDSVTNFQHVAAEVDTLVVDALIEHAERLSPEAIARVQDIALHEPLLLNRLISPTGHVTGVNVTLRIPGGTKEHAVPQITASARTIAADLRATYPALDIYLTGGVIMENAFGEATEHDLKTLIPLMLMLLIATLGVLLGAVVGTMVAVVVLFLSILTAMGLAGWLGITLSPSSAAAPTIIMTCALADCVHILAVFFQYLRAREDRHTAMVQALKHNAYAMCLTALTTMIGFFSMNFSEVPVFRDLGNISGIGVLCAFLLSVTLLPALMMVLPWRVAKPRRNWSDRVWQRWPELVVRWRRPLFWGMTGLTVVLLVCATRNELNDEFVKYFGTSIDFRRATDFTTDNLTGIYYIEYSLGAGAIGSIANPAYLAQVEAFANWYRQQPEALHVYTITDIFKLLNRVMHSDDPTWYRLPETQELSAQYLLLYEMSLPYGLDLNDRISVDKTATRLSVTLKSLSSRAVLALEERAQAWLAVHAPDLTPAAGSGVTLMFAHIGQRSIESMLFGTVMAEVLIALILIVAVRSIKIGLVSLVPNLVPAGMAFGLWGLAIGQVGMAASVIASMTLGIVVDDTVHFLTHYLEARRARRYNARQAVVYTVSTVGPPSLVTGIILMLGFAVLGFSSFAINSSMGLLTAIAIGFATLAEFVYLPPLLLTLEEKKDATLSVSYPAAEYSASASQR
jgi:predicted RND superfamily exporter protein